jgi:hypothetical protein
MVNAAILTPISDSRVIQVRGKKQSESDNKVY